MRVNVRMSDLLEGVEPCVREENVPDHFRAVVQSGWTVERGAQLLKFCTRTTRELSSPSSEMSFTTRPR
jgi:hypothetical protein